VGPAAHRKPNFVPPSISPCANRSQGAPLSSPAPRPWRRHADCVRRQPSRCGDSTPPDPGPCDTKVRAMSRRDHWHRGRPRLSLSRLQQPEDGVFRLSAGPRKPSNAETSSTIALRLSHHRKMRVLWRHRHRQPESRPGDSLAANAIARSTAHGAIASATKPAVRSPGAAASNTPGRLRGFARPSVGDLYDESMTACRYLGMRVVVLAIQAQPRQQFFESVLNLGVLASRNARSVSATFPGAHDGTDFIRA
jgi:hypothetical protein